MNNSISVSASALAHVTDRRENKRSTMVLKVGLLEFVGKSTFCLLRNVSPDGVQVKLYSAVRQGSEVGLRVGDESPLEGRIAWVRDGLAGITFKTPLDPTALLRVRQIVAPQRRRVSPRAQASGFAFLRTGGQGYSATLCDISASGARILTTRSIEPGRTAVLLLPKLPALRAFVRWTDERNTGLHFATPIPIQILTEWLAE